MISRNWAAGVTERAHMSNKSVGTLVLLAGLSLGLVGCGKEAGRVAFTGEGSQSSTLQLSAGELACSANLPKAGPTTVHATLAFGTRHASATLSKADLVLKQ